MAPLDDDPDPPISRDHGISVSLGAVRIPSPRVVHLLHPILGIVFPGGRSVKLLSSLICGYHGPSPGHRRGALSLAGAVLQALLRNPWLTLSSGHFQRAAVGAVLAILVGLGSTFLGIYAVPGSLWGRPAYLAPGLFYFPGGRKGSYQTMLLSGVIISSFFSASSCF